MSSIRHMGVKAVCYCMHVMLSCSSHFLISLLSLIVLLNQPFLHLNICCFLKTDLLQVRGLVSGADC